MARYYFHLCTSDDVLIDPDGREFADPALIIAAALKEARACISQDALDGLIRLGHSIEVRDAAGTVVHRLGFRDAVTVQGG